MSAEGERVPIGGVKRRTWGALTGATFRAEGAGAALAVCEGPLDALALASAPWAGEARATLGTRGAADAFADWGGDIVVVGDGDDAGRKWARGLARRVGARIVGCPEGLDPLDLYGERAP